MPDLTPEQISQLKQELARLPPEKLAELKKQQCAFCLMASNQIKTKKIFEDNHILAVLDINPATKGHTLIFPKKHYALLNLIPDEEISHIFNITNKLSSALIKTLNAGGTNIYVANGELAGQNIEHILIHLIPRYKDDGIKLTWQTKHVSEKELDIIQKSILSGIEKTIEKPKAKPKLEDIERFVFNPETRLA